MSYTRIFRFTEQQWRSLPWRRTSRGYTAEVPDECCVCVEHSGPFFVWCHDPWESSWQPGVVMEYQVKPSTEQVDEPYCLPMAESAEKGE